MTEAPDREAIIDAVAKARPWRTPSYLLLHFLRRWAVVLFTLSFMLATRQHWAVAGIAIAGSLWFDLKVTPNALDLRLDDREFVRKIYDLEVFEWGLTNMVRRAFAAVGIISLLIILALILAEVFLDRNTDTDINKPVIDVILFAMSIAVVTALYINKPIVKTPDYTIFNESAITLERWAHHGYDRSFTIAVLKLTGTVILIFLRFPAERWECLEFHACITTMWVVALDLLVLSCLARRVVLWR